MPSVPSPDDAPTPATGLDVARRLALVESVLRSAPLVLWAFDRAGLFTMSDGKGLAILGVMPDEFVGLSAFEMFHDNPAIAEALVRALAGESGRVVTTLAPGHPFETWFVPLRDPSGRICGAAALALGGGERTRGERESRGRLDLIERQSATIRALATPVLQVWDEVLCLPVIGTVDSARTAEMMQGLLDAVVREQARYAIVDLTGVEVVDTSTADHLVKLFGAARVLGVEGVLCGIRPAVAQTIVGLGLDLGSLRTMRTLRDALKWCIRSRSERRAESPLGDALPAGQASS